MLFIGNDNNITTTTSIPLEPIISLNCRQNDTFRFIKEFDGIPDNLVINLIVWSILLVLFSFLRHVEDFGRFGLLSRNKNEDEEERDKDIIDKCGKDALYYMMYQRYLIVYLTIVTLISICVILPVNINGNAFADKSKFSSTTIVNIDASSGLLWIHCTISWLFLILIFIFMRHLSARMHYKESELVSRTVIILDIPKNKCDLNLIKRYFNETYPDLEIVDMQLAYNTSKIDEIHRKRNAMRVGKETSLDYLNNTGNRPKMYPFHFGSLFEICCCCCGCKNKLQTIDAIDYYTDREAYLSELLNDETHLSFEKPLGFAFVTFKDEKMSDKLLSIYRKKLFKNPFYKCCNRSQNNDTSSELNQTLETYKWSIKSAPSPNDIKWSNLSIISYKWWSRWLIINIILFILMVFFTTPAILLETITKYFNYFPVEYFEKKIPSYLSDFLPSLLLRILSALLPVIVGYTALWERHWTRSSENHTMMIKTFIILVFMVLILPTLGLRNLSSLIEFLKNKKINYIDRECITDDGAFFVKYLITSSFIGTALDLLRLPELLMYIIKLLWSRSSSERLAVKLSTLYEFEYGTAYAWILTLFTVTICFSIICPFICTCGLIYMILKHLIDRYNIYFAYTFTKVDESIHKSALNFSIISCILLQFFILWFVAIKSVEYKNAMTYVQTLVILISCILFSGSIFFGLFKKLSLFEQSKKRVIIESPRHQMPINDTLILESSSGNDNLIDTTQQ